MRHRQLRSLLSWTTRRVIAAALTTAIAACGSVEFIGPDAGAIDPRTPDARATDPDAAPGQADAALEVHPPQVDAIEPGAVSVLAPLHQPELP